MERRAHQSQSMLQRSVFGQLMKYLLWMMHVGGIHVPDICFCDPEREQTKKTNFVFVYSINDTKPVLEKGRFKNKISFSKKNGDNNILHDNTLTNVRRISPETNKLCRCKSSTKTRTLKFLLILINGLFRLFDIIRFGFILRYSYHDNSQFVFSLIQALTYSYLFYLYVMNNAANYTHFRAFIKSWVDYEKKFGLAEVSKKLIRLSKIAFGMTIVYGFLQSASYIFLFGNFPGSLSFLSWPFNTDDMIIPGAVYNFVSSYLCCFTLTVDTMLFFLMRAIYSEFNVLSVKVIDCLHENIDLIEPEKKFDQFLEQMNSLVHVMEKTYDVIKHTVAACYMLMVPAYCCILYGVISGSMTFAHIVMAVCTLAIYTSLTVAVTYGGARVRDQVRQTVGVIAKHVIILKNISFMSVKYSNTFCKKKFHVKYFVRPGTQFLSNISSGHV